MNDRNLVIWSNNIVIMVYSLLVGSFLLIGGLQGNLDYFHFFAFVLAILFSMIVSIIVEDMFEKSNILVLIISNIVFYAFCRYVILMFLFLALNPSSDALDQANQTIFTPNVNNIVKVY